MPENKGKAAPKAGTFGSGKEKKYGLSIPPEAGKVKYRYIREGREGRETVEGEEALRHALEKCGIGILNQTAPEYEEFIEMLEGWYYQLWEKEETDEAGA